MALLLSAFPAVCLWPCEAAGREEDGEFHLVSSLPGSHSLRYNLTVVFHNRSVQSRLFAEGHLDGQPCLHYDSEKGKAEPQGLCAETVLGAETWDTETKDLTEKGKDLRRTLADIMALQDQKGDFHSLQEIWGCEIQEDNHARGLRHFYYDGKLFLSYNSTTCGWTVPQSSAQTVAMEIKKSWDADGFQSKDYWAQVQGELCGKLQRYVESWMGFMERTASTRGSRRVNLNLTHSLSILKEFGFRVQDRLGEGLGSMRASARVGKVGRGSPVLSISLRREQSLATSFTAFVLSSPVPPAVNVTCSQAAEGVVNVTCWAFRFSPQNISVTWLRDKEPLNQDVQQSGGVLPDRNGTYQTWVAIRIPQGEEQRFTCYVEHSGNHSTYPVPLGKALVHQSGWPAILGVTVVGVIGSITLFALWYKKNKKTTSAAESPGEKSGQ
ncbi:PREDICTED: MHC class I polypeptide-related sequence B-like [Ceratotherium simum simum]|uniref:MHC class I polypeptide-related sequence B-like n=1 Tax=Ceratotherium simum simum TaxID=73337 RepID=A0ABM1CES8_CERSS|nr:PREDICTED: MHC class I polypeptide-related sequence B-like [Ceratotherium simum simum]